MIWLTHPEFNVLRVTNFIKSRVVERLAQSCAMLLPANPSYLTPRLLQSEQLETRGSLAILVPHPDDEIIGLFHLLEQLGGRMPVDLIYVTAATATDVASTRRAESLSATADLSVRQRVYWNFPDGALADRREPLSARLRGVIDAYGLILCPAPGDRTPDHAVLAELTYQLAPKEALLWYRSTWWTFPLQAADFVVAGKARAKHSALRAFRSQGGLALGNVITLSAMEAKRCGLPGTSVEAFRYASSGLPSSPPLNVLSVLAPWRLRGWR